VSTISTELALGLAGLGFHVFPVNKRTKRPYIEGGHTNATIDAELIATWFNLDYPHAGVGVNAGLSGLVVLDLDRKNGVNGFQSVDDGWLELPPTFYYDTPSNGRHYIYKAPAGVRLAPARDYRKLRGVDRRAGSSYAVWYGGVPDGGIADAPKWLCDVAEVRVGAAFDGKLDDWLGKLPDGDPDVKVKDAIGRIPKGEFDHVEMIERQMEFVRLAAEGHTGVRVGLELLRREWLRPPYDTDDYAYEYDSGLSTCVKKFGAPDPLIAELPDYVSTLEAVPNQHVMNMIVGEAKPKKHVFELMRSLIGTDMTDWEVATILWSAPTVRDHSRKWGVEYLLEQIVEVRKKREVEVPPENPTVEKVTKSDQWSLLSEEENRFVDGYECFIDRYLDYAKQRSTMLNEPYHRMNAWTVLSLAFGLFGFVPEQEGAMGLNLFQIGLGESSTGKTRALKLRDAVLKEFFTGDVSYDLGSDASIQALHEILLERDNKPSFFNADEAAVTFAQMVEMKWLSGMESFLTRLYEGYVPPMLRRGKESKNRTAMTSFNIAMYGTPDRVTDILTRDMFLTGFLPRFVWTYGTPPVESEDQYKISQATGKRVRMEYDPIARSLAVDLVVARRVVGPGRHPMVATDEALQRMSQASKDMKEKLVTNENWRILEPSWKRLSSEAVRKAASLLALSEGETTVRLRHVLYVLREAENWLESLVKVSNQISASLFQRECDDMERYVVSNGGSVARSKLVNKFSMWKYREFADHLESLIQQGRLREDQTGAKIEVNM
jgi:hypothetical protein